MKRLITLIICTVMGSITIFICGIVGDIHFWEAARRNNPEEKGHGVPFISVIGIFAVFIYIGIMSIFIALAIRRYVKLKKEEQKTRES